MGWGSVTEAPQTKQPSRKETNKAYQRDDDDGTNEGVQLCVSLGLSSGWLGEIIFWSLVLVQFMMTSSCLDDQNRTIIEFIQILLSCLCRLLVIAKCVNPLALILRSPESVTVMPPSGLLIRTLYPLWTDDGASDHGSAYPRTVCKLISS